MHQDEGVLDPWVAEWLEANAAMMEPPAEYSLEYLQMARPAESPFPTRPVARVTDEVVDGVPVRIYEHDHAPTGVLVYFHGGGFCTGSIGLMELIATELAHCSGAAVVSVGYRLAPEHPYPAGLDDCETVTRWAIAHAERFGTSPDRVAVGGESAGGNLSTAVALRLRGDATAPLAAQVLLYPGTDGRAADHPSRRELDSPMLRSAAIEQIWDMYVGARDLDHDPCVAPLHAESLAGLPPAFVLLGGCDPLRDEGRLYAQRLAAEGVPTVELCLAGQPHGFLNLGFPASADAYAAIGPWLRDVFAERAAAPAAVGG